MFICVFEKTPRRSVYGVDLIRSAKNVIVLPHMAAVVLIVISFMGNVDFSNRAINMPRQVDIGTCPFSPRFERKH